MNILMIKNLIILGRFHFLLGGFLLFLLGAFLAIIDGALFDPYRLLFAYMIMLPAHLGLSYSNNYFDISVDQYSNPGIISGGTKILIDFPELKYITKLISLTLMVVSLVVCIFSIFVYHFSILFFGFVLGGNLLGWFYTAPPLRLAYRGIGEIANMITMGVLMPGLGFWGMFGSLRPFFLIIMIPFMLYGLYFIITVELPDVEADGKGNKRNFLVRYGRDKGYVILFFTALGVSLFYGVLIFLPIFSNQINFIFLTLISGIPLSVAVIGLNIKFKETILIKTWAVIQMTALILVMFVTNVYLLLVILNL